MPTNQIIENKQTLDRLAKLKNNAETAKKAYRGARAIFIKRLEQAKYIIQLNLKRNRKRIPARL